MRAHNVNLPHHIYVWVKAEKVMATAPGNLIPAVWFGLSATPARALGCHVLLENGAMLADLPLNYLAHEPSPEVPGPDLRHVQEWDSFGWDITTVAFDYLRDLHIQILAVDKPTEPPYATINTGTYLFTLDFIDNGWSDNPEQHKTMNVIARDDGWIGAYPNDRLIWHDRSFTVIDPDSIIPPIKRQRDIHYCEEPE